MKVLLVNLPYLSAAFGGREESADINPPLGIAYIASFLRQYNIEVDVLDSNALNYTTEKTIQEIKQSKADIVGLTATTITMPLMKAVAAKIKTEDNLIIAGGVHVSSLPEQTLKSIENIDIAVIGEGEYTLLEITEEFKNNRDWSSIKGIAYRADGRIVRTGERDMIRNLDSLPFPARDLLPRHRYQPGPILQSGIKGERFTTVVTARGCTKKCTYCASGHFWKYLRMRSAENIIKELRFLKDKYAIQQIMFVDDTFTCSKPRLLKICSALAELKIRWTCYARVTRVDMEMLKAMRKAGCFFIFYGVESGSQKILDNIKKGITLEEVEKVIKLTKKSGIITNCSFMLGLPGDTKETMQETLDFAKKINPHLAEFYVTTPFPGTELYQTAISKKWIVQDDDWSKYSLHRQNTLRTCEVDPKEVEAFAKKCYKEFYSRPSFMLMSLKKLITWPKSFYVYRNCLKIFYNLMVKDNLP